MKNTTFLVLCFFLSMTYLTQAKAGGFQSGQEKRVAVMTKALNLTDEQSVKYSAICDETFTKLDSLRKAHGSRSDMKPIMKTYDEKVMAILTDDQKTRYKNIKLKMNSDARGL